MKCIKPSVIIAILFAFYSKPLLATTYDVGPTMPYTTIGSVPWDHLVGGDSVKIYWKPTPYYEKILIGVRGTPTSWFRVIGVPNSNGDLPIIDGANATTGPNMNWFPNWSTGATYDIEGDGVVSLACNNYTQVNPAYVEIANLCIRNARAGTTYTGGNNLTGVYSSFAAAIHAKNPQHIIIRNCEISNSENGFFNNTSSVQGGSLWWNGLAEDILITGNYFHDNGSSTGDFYEHTIYTQADRVVIEKNRFGPMATTAAGNQIKDRSSGTVIRYNYFEHEIGARIIDLVEDQDAYPVIANKPYYGHDFIYGNIFIQVIPGSQGGGSGTIHWDGDHYSGGRATAPNSRLYFYHNTWVINEDPQFAPEVIFSIQDAGDNCPSGNLTSLIDVRNNIFYCQGTSGPTPHANLTWASCPNTNIYLDKNWVSGNVGSCYWYTDTTCSGNVSNTSSSITTPNNVVDFYNLSSYDLHLLGSSTAIGQGVPLATGITSDPLGIDGTPNFQYASQNYIIPRALYGTGSDLGAFSYSSTYGLEGYQQETQSVFLYPNPNNGEFTILSLYQHSNSILYNSVGERIFSIDLRPGENKLQMPNLAKGIYFIKCNNSLVKFIVQ